MAQLESLGIFLGPYRNLTTLTAAVLALHPECQVLNHGGEQLLPRRELDFLASPTRATFDRFCQVAVKLSRAGERGWRGGSITLSHAFEFPVLRDAFRSRFGDETLKPRVVSLIWKESLLVSRAMRRNRVDVGRVVRRNKRIRFLVPIRNPMDCAVSSLATGHASLLVRRRERHDVENVLEGVMRELSWAYKLSRSFPDRVCVFVEDDLGAELLGKLADFLSLSRDARWLADASRCFAPRASYDHKAELVARYRTLVLQKFGHAPELTDRLLGFCEPRRSGRARTTSIDV